MCSFSRSSSSFLSIFTFYSLGFFFFLTCLVLSFPSNVHAQMGSGIVDFLPDGQLCISRLVNNELEIICIEADPCFTKQASQCVKGKSCSTTYTVSRMPNDRSQVRTPSGVEIFYVDDGMCIPRSYPMVSWVEKGRFSFLQDFSETDCVCVPRTPDWISTTTPDGRFEPIFFGEKR